MDVLSDVLRKVRITSAVYFKSEFSSPWGMDIPAGPFAQFHIVTRGQCFLNASGESIQLYSGDIVVFPFGIGHWLADDEGSDRKMGQEVVQTIQKGMPIFEGEHPATTLVCGHFEFDRTIDHPLVHELPPMMLISDQEKREFTWLDHIVDLIIHESAFDKPGGHAIVDKLGETLFMYVLRAWIYNHVDHGFLAATQDLRISTALKAIHSNPENNWQLQSLAQVAGMSRTSFSNRFKALVGDTAMNYITQWRILQAKELLKESNNSVGQIAYLVGYQSEAAFNKVFKKRVTLTPLKYRQSLVAS